MEALHHYLGLWDFPWKTFVLWPCSTASVSHASRATKRQFRRKTGRTLLGLPDAVNSDSLPREVLKTLFLENCEGKIEQFIKKIVNDIDESELKRRLIELTITSSADSVSSLTAAQIEQAFSLWGKKEE